MQDRRDLDQLRLAMAEREERVLAQELHETLCQSLAGVTLLARAMLRAKEAGRDIVLSDLVRMEQHLEAAVEQSRLFVHSSLLAREPQALPQVLETLVKLALRHVGCVLQINGPIHLDRPEIAQVFYRIAREATRNVLREAEATRIDLRLRQAGDELTLTILHDGHIHQPGSNPPVPILAGDGMLECFAHAVGLGWTITTDDPSGARLDCVFREGQA
jgi:signal transduction histidine kinase